MPMQAKLHVHKAVTVGAKLPRLIYSVPIDIIFPGYAHHKGFTHIN